MHTRYWPVLMPGSWWVDQAGPPAIPEMAARGVRLAAEARVAREGAEHRTERTPPPIPAGTAAAALAGSQPPTRRVADFGTMRPYQLKTELKKRGLAQVRPPPPPSARQPWQHVCALLVVHPGCAP
jgi:hypothetical protein